MTATPIIAGVLYRVSGNGLNHLFLAENGAHALERALDLLGPESFNFWRTHG